MPRKKKAVESAEEVKETVEEVAQVKEVETVETPKEYSVFKNNEFVRTYSLEAHGENFKQLAQGFAQKIGGNLK